MRSTRRSSRAATAVILALLTVQYPLAPAIIVVDESCSLADAITAANGDSATGACTAGAGADELQLTADVVLIDALPSVASDIDVEGSGFTIVRDPAEEAFRIFQVRSNSTLHLRNVTVSGGDAGSGWGGAASVFYGSALTLTNSTLSGNTADHGGAIYHYGNVTLVGSTISGNSAVNGGGIWTQGLLQVTAGSLITGNHATAEGGGIGERWYGTVVISDSTVSYNVADGMGGGVYISKDQGSFDYSSVSIANSTISGNSAGTDGGGLRLDGGSYYGGPITVVNSTVSGNSATRGGGIFHADGYFFTLANSTLSGNSAALGGGLYSLDEIFRGTPYLSGSIVAGNPGGGNCGGSLAIGGLNFDDDGTCVAAGPIVPGVDFETALADNGGPTLTHALFDGSVATDAAGACGLATDQRGVPRDDGACDAGSFELGSPAFTLEIAGSCPGPVVISVSTPEPDQGVSLFVGANDGSSIVTTGGCAGTELDITLSRSWRNVRTDGNGAATLNGNVAANWCGRHLQAVDRNCSTSNVVEFP